MSLNPAGTANYSWNYTDPQRAGYSLEMYGTVVALQEVQHRDYITKQPTYWPDGNPIMDIRVAFAAPDGSLKTIQFQKAGKKQASGEKPSLHMQLFNLTNSNMYDLIGKTVHIWTWPNNPNNSQEWGRGNPRLFGVEEVKDTTYSLATALPEEYKIPELYANDAVSGGQPIQQAPQMAGQFYAAPQAAPVQQVPMQQPVPQAVPMQQPVPQAIPVQQVPQPMPVTPSITVPPQQVPMQPAPQPVGMDPAVAQAMQAVGAGNIQQVQPAPADPVYGDIPF